MADQKVLNTRISLKYDSYANWITHDPVLLKGEIAISTHENDATPPATGFQNIPNIAMKVGNGTSKYSELKFVSALAADVYSWAKAASKPTYTANEISGLDEFINKEIQDTDTRYKLVKVDGSDYNYNLMSSADGATYDTLVSTIDLSGVASRLGALEGKVGEDSVSDQIDAKIGALDMAKVTVGQGEIIESIEEAEGVISVTKRGLVAADIPELAQGKITGLTDALAGKQENLAFEGTYNAETNKVVTKSYVTTQIESLDKADTAVAGQFVTAVSEANGIISVSRDTLKESDIPTLSMDKIDGLDDALAALQEDLVFDGTYDAANNKVATVSTVTNAINGLDADGKEAAAGEIVSKVSQENGIVKVETRALVKEDIPTIEQNQVNGLGTALSAKQDELGFAGEYNKASNPVATKIYVDTMVADLNGAMHFEGVVTGDTFEDAIANAGKVFVTGDVVLYGLDEYVFDGANWHALGNENIYALKTDVATDIAAAKKELQDQIDDLGENKQDVLTFDGTYNETSNKVATQTTVNNAIGALDMTQVTAGEGQIIEYVKQENGAVTAGTRALVAADIPELAIGKIAGLQTALDGKQANLTFEGTYNASTNKVATQSTVTNAINALDKTDTAKTGQFVTAVSEENGIITVSRAALAATDIPTITQAQVSGLTDALAAAGQQGTDAAAQALADAKTYADGKVETAIDGLDSSIAEESNKVVSAFSIVNGVITASSVKKVSLANIATTGNVNDLQQTAGTYVVFDWGYASVYV